MVSDLPLNTKLQISLGFDLEPPFSLVFPSALCSHAPLHNRRSLISASVLCSHCCHSPERASQPEQEDLSEGNTTELQK